MVFDIDLIKQIAYLTDELDTIAAYEERGKHMSVTSSYDKGLEALQTMNRVQQVELVHGVFPIVIIKDLVIFKNHVPHYADIATKPAPLSTWYLFMCVGNMSVVDATVSGAPRSHDIQCHVMCQDLW